MVLSTDISVHHDVTHQGPCRRCQLDRFSNVPTSQRGSYTRIHEFPSESAQRFRRVRRLQNELECLSVFGRGSIVQRRDEVFCYEQ
jgi:hypothetical protein